MKKVFLGILPILLVTLYSCAGASKKDAVPAEPKELVAAVDTNTLPPIMTLDSAIKEASDQIDKLFEANSKIALVNFDSPSDNFSAYVLDEITANLVTSRKLEVIDRKEVELRRGELNFQMSGEVDDNSIQELGRTLGAKNIVSGSLTNLGSVRRIVIRALNVETGRVEVQYRNNIANDNIVRALLAGGKSNKTVATQTISTIPATENATETPTTEVAEADVQEEVSEVPAEPENTYKIGDTGPAGGLIFYDKGNDTGGWRYLEAALADFENLRDVSEPINTGGLVGRAVGKGEENTEAIMTQAVNLGGGFGWGAQAADAYSMNGFDDWFLPSRDELHYMYGNLHMQGLGSFKNDWYMTSTAKEASTQSTCFWYENFRDGIQGTYCSDKAYVRPIRRF